MGIDDIKVLLVNNSSESIKKRSKMLNDIGISSVSVASNYEQAFDVISHANINIVVLGSNIDGKVDAVKTIQNIKESGGNSISIIFEPEVFDKALMLSVMEHEPDDVIIDSDDEGTKKRYLKNINMFIETNDIRKKIDNGDLSSASVLCAKFIQLNYPSKAWCIRKKLEIYLLQSNFSSLENYSRYLLKDMNLEFIRVYLAKSLFEQKCFNDAIMEAATTISMFPMSSKSYLVKGESHLSLGEYNEAVECFTISTHLSPHSFFAKKKLLQAHEINENYDECKKEYLTLIDMAENTSQETPELYGKVITVTNKKVLEEGRVEPEFKEGGERLILEMTNKFPDSEFVTISSMMFLSQVEFHNGKKEESERIIDNIKRNYAHVYLADESIMFNLILTCFSIEDFNSASSFSEKYSEIFPESNETKFIDKQNTKKINKDNLKKAAFCNLKAKQSYIDKDFDTAIKYLKISTRMAPDYPVYYVNLIKVIISKISKHGLDFNLINDASSYINTLTTSFSTSKNNNEAKALRNSLDNAVNEKKKERDELVIGAFKRPMRARVAS